MLLSGLWDVSSDVTSVADLRARWALSGVGLAGEELGDRPAKAWIECGSNVSAVWKEHKTRIRYAGRSRFEQLRRERAVPCTCDDQGGCSNLAQPRGDIEPAF